MEPRAPRPLLAAAPRPRPLSRRSTPLALACMALFIAVATVLLATQGAIHPKPLARAQAVAAEGDSSSNRYDNTPTALKNLRGGGQVTSCLGGGMGANVVVPELEEPKTSQIPKKAPTAVGFFADLGKRANALVKFGGDSKVDVTFGTVQKGVKVTGSMVRSLFDDNPPVPEKYREQKATRCPSTGEGVQGKYGYWAGADSKMNIEGGLAAKNDFGDGKKLDLYVSSKLLKPKTVEAEAVFSSGKLNASLRAPGASSSATGSVAGAFSLDPSKTDLGTLKSSSAIGAQYTAPDYTISATTEGFGAVNRATLSSKLGDKDVAVAASMNGMGENLALATGVRASVGNGVSLKAGLATSGDVDVELSRKFYHHIGVKLGAKANLNSPSTLPKFGAQISLEAKP
eukprot:jgi/Bigna1/88096/estExt_fgenesh1_pg.C_280044